MHHVFIVYGLHEYWGLCWMVWYFAQVSVNPLKSAGNLQSGCLQCGCGAEG